MEEKNNNAHIVFICNSWLLIRLQRITVPNPVNNWLGLININYFIFYIFRVLYLIKISHKHELSKEISLIMTSMKNRKLSLININKWDMKFIRHSQRQMMHPSSLPLYIASLPPLPYFIIKIRLNIRLVKSLILFLCFWIVLIYLY
jgi:hypothetical protein